eukprot:6030237-Amphidinium_carterae.1
MESTDQVGSESLIGSTMSVTSSFTLQDCKAGPALAKSRAGQCHLGCFLRIPYKKGLVPSAKSLNHCKHSG